jgi:hypothetical protein
VKIILVFCLAVGILWHFNGCRIVKVQTPSGELYFPKKDAKRLEYFFRELIVYNSAGYTFLGEKPVSFECFTKPRFEWDFSYLWHTFLPSNIKKHLAWKTWQRYEHLFNKGDILIWSESSPWIKNGELIVVASKRQIEQVDRENQKDIAVLIDHEPKALFNKALHSHEELLGILLGYGRTNAMLFHKRASVALKPVFSKEIRQLFKSKKTSLNFTFGWPNVEMDEILSFPSFMADLEGEETQRLKASYLQTRKTILDYYAKKDFLEATLHLIL